MIPSSHRRWSSRADPQQQAVELVPSPGDADALAVALSRAANGTTEIAFLVVPVEGIEASAVMQAVDSFHGAGGTVRLCLAGSRMTLESIHFHSLDCDRIGLLLDDVTVDTPLSELLWNRIEALRFAPDYVSKAARDLRTGFALHSMLNLARDTGLCTFGFDAMPDGGTVTGRSDFDYHPVIASMLPNHFSTGAHLPVTAVL